MICCSLHYDKCVSKLPNNAYAYFAIFSSCTKVQPKNVSQYPPKSQTMNTTCLTLILVSMLVANATASLAFPRQAPVEWTLNPINDPGKIIDCRPDNINVAQLSRAVTGSDITIDAKLDESGVWKVSVEAPSECRVVEFDISNRSNGIQSVELYPHQFPYIFKNVSVLFLIPASDKMVAAWI